MNPRRTQLFLDDEIIEQTTTFYVYLLKLTRRPDQRVASASAPRRATKSTAGRNPKLCGSAYCQVVKRDLRR